MKIRIRSALAGAAALVVAGGILVGGGAAAYAAVTPGWEPDASALGSITFYNASGQVVNSGSLSTNPVALYAVASGPGRSGDTKAQLKAFTPQVGVLPGLWSGDILTGATNYPVTAAGTPAVISGTTNPVATGTATDFSFNDYIGEFPNSTTASGYQNLYELRLYTSGAGQGQGATYYRTDVQVDTTAGTWTVVFPSAVVTTTTLSGSPGAGNVAGGTSVTLTATVAATGASSIPGSVHFFDGATDLGAASNYNASTGVATTTVTIAAGSSHTYTAAFTPADATAFGSSTSNALSYSAGTPTTTTVSASPASPVTLAAGQTTASVNLTATVAPTGTAGGVHFFDGATDLGAGTYTASSGTATMSASLAAGTHTITATFTPTATGFTPSTSLALSYTVIPSNFGTGSIQLQAQDNTAPYAGSLSFAVATTTVALTQVDPSTAAGHPALATDSTGHRHGWVFTGNLGGVKVSDTRPTQPGWTVTGQTADFTVPTGSQPVTAKYLGWSPALVSTGSNAEGTVTAGGSVSPYLSAPTSTGLSTATNLAKATAGSGLGDENLSAGLTLWIPDTSPTGAYQSTLTLTLVSP
ncbi:MAG TPA: Ig-like domain repeat protein [Rugosimonospora sp.]|nr:Ig-like domain repeat protein [Rugosimonospora sp.]